MNRLDTISFGKIVQIREKISHQISLGKKVYRFESGDPSFSVAEHVSEAMHKAILDKKTHYLPNDGIPELRKALAEKSLKKNNIKVNDTDIFVTNGAMHALFVVFQSLLEVGDEVVVPEPLWTEIGENIRLSGGVLSKVILTEENNYAYTLSDIKTKITSRTKAIFINTPHNPTGAIVPESELRKIAEYAAQENLYLICDEAYEDLVFEGKHYSAASGVPNYLKTVSIYSFSKSHAMPGLRVGYIVTKDQELQKRIQKLLRCSVNGINSIAQWGALAAVSGPQEYLQYMRDQYLIRRNLFYKALENIPGLSVFNPKGAFYLWCTITSPLLDKYDFGSVNEFSEYLIEQGIGNAPGDSFGDSCEHSVRFSFSGSTQMIVDGSHAINALLTKETTRFIRPKHFLESNL